jgi:hypothetical protein
MAVTWISFAHCIGRLHPAQHGTDLGGILVTMEIEEAKSEVS